MGKREDIVAEARKWIGTPWRHHGRNEHGIDCVGLGVVVTRALNICDYDNLDYSRKPKEGLVDHIRQVADEIKTADVMPGDFYLLQDNGYPFHVAFASVKYGVPHIIHAHARRRQVVEEPATEDYMRLVTHAFRFKGVKP